MSDHIKMRHFALLVNCPHHMLNHHLRGNIILKGISSKAYDILKGMVLNLKIFSVHVAQSNRALPFYVAK